MTRRVPVPFLALAVVAAFLLGSVGSAVAGPALTTKAVKKIATKVVKKQASRLAVKDSKRLDGRPAAAYEERALVFPLSSPAASSKQQFTVALEPGEYVISYAVYLNGASTYTYCNLWRERGAVNTQYADDSSEAASPSLSATGVVEVTAGDVVSLTCASMTSWSAATIPVPQVVAQPVDSTTSQPVVSTPASRAGYTRR